jgi:hypothetical protein
MRRYGIYDARRGLTLALAAGVSGFLLYLATQVGQQSTVRFWEELGLVAAAGVVLALAPVLGGWTSGLRLRLSRGTFLLAFLPVLIVAGWILLATQPGNGWHEGTIVSWSSDLGLMGLVHSLALWHGVLAFGFGLVLGSCLDAVPTPVAPEVVDDDVIDRTLAQQAADEPLAAEQREAAHDAEPHTVMVGPHEPE